MLHIATLEANKPDYTWASVMLEKLARKSYVYKNDNDYLLARYNENRKNTRFIHFAGNCFFGRWYHCEGGLSGLYKVILIQKKNVNGSEKREYLQWRYRI